MSEERYSRHIAFFGAEGQKRIQAASVAIVGLGGLGAHVAQQLAYLGVGEVLLIDGDSIERSNLNRLIGASESDVGAAKVDVARRSVERINPNADVGTVACNFDPEMHGEMLGRVDALFGCVDGDAARLDLLRSASEAARTYIDLASDITQRGEFGGRVVFAKDGERCLSCLGELDQHALARARMTDEQRAADDSIYGVERSALGETGPSVVSVNGVVASLAVTEFFVWLTGVREPRGFVTYRGDRATVGARADPERKYCHYCMALWGSKAAADGSS